MLPVAFATSQLVSFVGGVAAAMAIGAFVSQARPRSISAAEEVRRRNTAIGGLTGMAAMIGLILLLEIGW